MAGCNPPHSWRNAMELTERQRYLLRACVNAEIENSDQCETQLSLEITEDADDPDAAVSALREELAELLNVLS